MMQMFRGWNVRKKKIKLPPSAQIRGWSGNPINHLAWQLILIAASQRGNSSHDGLLASRQQAEAQRTACAGEGHWCASEHTSHL